MRAANLKTKPTQLLREDHRKIKAWFKAFREAKTAGQKSEIVRNVLAELRLHAAIEEEIFYPAVRQYLHDPELINEAHEEHHVVKLLSRELERMEPHEERYDAKFTVLAENVRHHMEEEELHLFPKAEKMREISWLGERMWERKTDLTEGHHWNDEFLERRKSYEKRSYVSVH